MILNLLAVVAMAGVAYMLAVQGAYRAAQTLVACVLAGALAFGLFGPLAALLPAADTQSVWYYAADAFCLWAVFCVAFLGLRTAAEHWLPVQPAFPAWADWLVGAALGALAGYLTVGVCLVFVQMLPVAPDLWGYEPFQYVPAKTEAERDAVKPGEPLWLAWDRGALALFGYLSSRPLGSEETGLLQRYGDVYPPKENQPPNYQAAVDADDFLYYYWYRRWRAVRWRTGMAAGPVAPAPKAPVAGHGLALDQGRDLTVNDVSVRVINVLRTVGLDDFAAEHPPAGEEFMRLTLRFRAVKMWPKKVDTDHFYLIDTLGARVGGPARVYGLARGGPKSHVEVTPVSAKMLPRSLRYGFPAGGEQGHFLADGAAFEFIEEYQYETRTLVFTIPKLIRTESVRLMLDPNPPPVRPAPVPGVKPPVVRPPAPAPRSVTPPAPPPATPPVTPPEPATPPPEPIGPKY